MSNTIAPLRTDLVRSLDDLVRLSRMLLDSRLLPESIKTAAQAAVIILKGRELGVGPMEAFSGISVIQGKPTVGPQLMLALVNRTGLLEDMSIEDDGQTCTVTLTRKGRRPHATKFSMADAAAMKLDARDNWKKQPAVMRQWRAVSAACRVVFPDVLAGMYTPEEMGAEVDDEGQAIAGELAQRIETERERTNGDADDKARWAAFVAESGATPLQVRAALGVERVSEWLAADPNRTLDDAIGLVEQQALA